MPEQEPPLEIWRISVQVLLPAPNGAYTGCKAAGRGEERSPGGSGADASPKKAPPPTPKSPWGRRHTYVAPLRFAPVGACPEVSLRPHMNFDNRHCGILRRDPTINDQKTTPPRKCRDGGRGAKVARFFRGGSDRAPMGGPNRRLTWGPRGRGRTPEGEPRGRKRRDFGGLTRFCLQLNLHDQK